MKKENRSTGNDGLNRRSFVKGSAGAALAAGVLHSLGLPALAANQSISPSLAKTYVCPPCGAPCDKLSFDKPGVCPQCGMDLIPFGGGEGTPPKVAILLFNAAEIIDFAGPWEVFGTAGLLVHTVAEKAEPLTMVFGQKVIPDYTFENSPKADVLLVPGGGVWSNDAIGNPKLIQWIQAKSKDVMYVMSVCTGAFLLAKAGLLVNQTVTATYGMIEDLQTPQTKVVYDQRFVESGNLITTAGLSSGIDGALHLIAKILGPGKAQSVALGMEYRWDPNSQYARASMADRFLPDGLAYGKPKVKGLEATMISTAGDTDRWEAKILVSDPHSSGEILALMRDRIGANTARGGMFKPIPHIRGAVDLSPASPGDSRIKWKFADDQGRGWEGSGMVEAAPDDKGKFVVTLRITREKA
jgi:putative intracellular protease/amidase